MDRRTFIAGLGVSAAMPLPLMAQPAATLAFLAVGDWGYRGGRAQRPVAAAMGEAASEVSSRFVLSVGDNFYPAGVASTTDPHWKKSFEDVYTAGALQTPWYAALGNHDYRGDPQAQIDYARISHRWRMPAKYYLVSGREFGREDLDIFVLDTQGLIDSRHEETEQLLHGRFWERDRRAQLRWLEAGLAASTAPWKIVVGHHPVYSGGRNGDEPVLLARVKPLLERYGVQLYLNGHDHDLQHIRRGPVDYVCTGSGGEAGRTGPIDGTLFCLSRPGFAAFRLERDELQLEFRDQDRASVYAAQISRQRA